MEPSLQLLGRAHAVTEDGIKDLPDNQTTWFCAFLCCRDGWVGRDEILGIFWPDEDERVARHNLSQLLYNCRKQTWASGLEAERTRVRLELDSDVKRFRDAVARGEWQHAVELYRGDLLESTVVGATSGQFQDWLELERESLQVGWREGAVWRALELEGAGEFAQAADLLAPVMRRDLLAEEVLQPYIRCVARSGRRDMALQAFEQFRQRLAEDLGMEPLEETIELAEAIRTAGPLASSRFAVSASPTGKARPSKPALPPQPTPFVGRALELAELGGLLQSDGTRLVTLLGPGGVGKTRLALETAREMAHAFDDGVVFVPLAPLGSVVQIPRASLESLGVEPVAGHDPEEQLLELLIDKEMLLLLDNFEHLLSGASLITRILEATSSCKLIVTSRQPLGLLNEVIYEVEGLAYPALDMYDDIEEYDAVALFVRSARRVQAGFTLPLDQKQAVRELCRLLSGQPLGLELAANWIRLLSPTEIVAELSSTLDLLEITTEELPPRHRSLRALFDSSWSLLTDEDRSALRRLAIFRSGFDRLAAQRVAGVGLRTLLSLLNKSLLTRKRGEAFEWHVAVQQYAEMKLSEHQDELKDVRHSYLKWAVGLAEEAAAASNGPDEAAWLEKLAAHHSNLNSALELCLQVGDTETGLRLGAYLWEFWYFRGHYSEGLRFLTAVLAAPDAAAFPRWQAKALISAGILCHGQGRDHASRDFFLQAVGPTRELGDPFALAELLNNLGGISQEMGDYRAAHEYHRECLDLRRAQADEVGIAMSLNNLGNLFHSEEKYSSARECYEEGLILHRRLGNQKGTSYSLTGLGMVAFEAGRLAEARSLFEESLAIRRTLGFRFAVAELLCRLGNVALSLGDGTGAREALRESLAIMVEDGSHDSAGIASSLEGLAALAIVEGRHYDGIWLSAAARALRTESGAALTRAASARLEGHLLAAQGAMTPERFEEALTAGRARAAGKLAELVVEASTRAQLTPG